MSDPRTRQALAAGRVFADLRVHAFTDAPPLALCGAGVLMFQIGSWSDLDEDADTCVMCDDILRRYGPTGGH